MRRPLAGGWRAANAVVLVASVALTAVGGASVIASTAPSWSAPAAVAATDEGLIEPIVLPDSSGAVHLFFADGTSRPGGPTTALRYARWVEGRWSEPATLLAPGPGASLSYPALAIDERGWLHAVYAGPRWGRIEHRRVHLSAITDAKAWSRPTTLSQSSGLHSTVQAGPGQQVYVLYASNDRNVFFHRSDDAGRTWSKPLALADLDPAQEACDGPHLAVDARGRLHAVWTQFRLPKGWPPTGVYYRRSVDGGRTWLPARQVAGEGSERINVVAHGAGAVHLTWSAGATADRMHQRSDDGGATWGAPLPVGNRVRGAGLHTQALGFDSGGTLHLVTSVGGPGDHDRIVHVTWDGTAWSEPQLISAGAVGTESVGLPSLAIAGGNHLHVVYEGDHGHIWYTERRVGAPPIEPLPVPTQATDLWTRFAEASPLFRALVALLALLGVEGSASWLRRHRRRVAP